MVSAFPAWLMAAWPETTWPPVGKALGSSALAGLAVASKAAATREPTTSGRLNHPAATFSFTAIHISRVRDQINR